MTNTRAAAAATVVVLVAVALCSCGGDPDDATSAVLDSDSTVPTLSDETERERPPEKTTPRLRPDRKRPQPKDLVDFLDCLHDHGLDVSAEDLSGGSLPFDPRDPAIRESVLACRAKLPAGVGPGRR